MDMGVGGGGSVGYSQRSEYHKYDGTLCLSYRFSHKLCQGRRMTGNTLFLILTGHLYFNVWSVHYIYCIAPNVCSIPVMYEGRMRKPSSNVEISECLAVVCIAQDRSI